MCLIHAVGSTSQTPSPAVGPAGKLAAPEMQCDMDLIPPVAACIAHTVILV